MSECQQINLREEGFYWLDNDNQFLSFSIYTEVFGLELLAVQEVIRYQGIKLLKVPNPAAGINGVINFRGEVIPVIDLRQLFGLTGNNFDKDTAIIILRLEDSLFGLVVDKILDIVILPESRQREIGEFEQHGRFQYLKAIAEVDSGSCFIIDPTKI